METGLGAPGWTEANAKRPGWIPEDPAGPLIFLPEGTLYTRERQCLGFLRPWVQAITSMTSGWIRKNRE